MMHDEGDSYGRSEPEDKWNEDKRKAYVKRMIKASHDQDPQFRRPDYVTSMASGGEASEAPAGESHEEPRPKPVEKKKEQYEL